MTSSQMCLVFDVDNLEAYRPDILLNAPQPGFVRCSSHGYTWAMGFGEEDRKGEVRFLSHRIGYTSPVWFIAVDVDLDRPAKVAYMEFLCCNIIPLPPPSILSSLEVSVHGPYWRSGSEAPPTWGQNFYTCYLEFCTGYLSLLSHFNSLRERWKFLTGPQDLYCLQLRVIYIPRWHMLGRPVLNPFKVKLETDYHWSSVGVYGRHSTCSWCHK